MIDCCSVVPGRGFLRESVPRLILIAALAFSAWPLGQVQAQEGNAAGFEIDDCGTLFSGDGPNDTPVCTPRKDVSCTAIPAGDDWAQGPAFNGIFDNDGMANIDPGTGDPYRAFLLTDHNWGNQGDGFDPSQFGSTSDKNNNPIGVGELPWTWNGVGGGPQKNDITNTYVYTYVDGVTGHRWVAVAAETRSNNGDSHVDVEFNFAGLTVTEDPPGSASGFIYGNGPAGGRTLEDDFIISIDFQQGGGLPIGTVRIWTETAPGVYEYVLVQDLGIDTTGAIFSATNICDAVHNTGGGDWTHFASNGAPSTTLLSFQMVEMAADLTALGIDVNPCSPNSTVLFKTRSSQSFTAELKDWSLIAFPFEPTPECAIDGPPLVCPGDEDIVYTVEEITGLSDTTFDWTIAGNATFCDGTMEATGDSVCVDADMVCDGNFMLIVTATRGECVSTCLFLVDINDEVPPEITCPDDISVQCIEDVPDPDIGLVTASDNCGPVTVTWEGDVSDGNTCPEIITRTYRATDFCENFTDCTQIITVDDTIPPEITCPGDVTVQCIEDVPDPDTGLVDASDNCGPVTVTHAGDVAEGTCPTVITRTYQAEDACGNISTCDQIITVDDTIPPVITCPDDVTVQCIEDVPPPDVGAVSATDNCGDATVTWEGDEAVGTCPTIITRTYQAEDACGNTSTCDQIITVDDTIPPVITCPGPVTVQCIDDVPAPNTGAVSASDNCGEVSVTWEGDELSAAVCPLVITRTYQAEDECGNISTCTQLITVDDTIPPEITCPDDLEVQCIEDVPAPDVGAVVATDNCGDVTVTWEGDERSGAVCPLVITRTYQAEDECGNISTCTQLITVNDTIPPVITCPDPITVECIEDVPAPDVGAAIAVDNCGNVSISWEGDESAGTCPTIITRTYRATDECGNFTDCFQLITVDDTTPPEITCPDDVTVQCIEDVPDADIGLVIASDNCGPVTVTWEGDVSDQLTCPETITRTYRATDECDNVSECVQLIVVDDTIPPVITCPDDATYECDAVPTDFGAATASDNCDDDVEIDVAEEIIPGPCPQTYDIVRTFTAVDDCGNEATCDQIISVVDTTPPEITCPDDQTVQCIEDVPAPNPDSVTAVDNCSTVTVTWEGDEAVGECPTIITRTYQATDECGNVSSCTQIITVDDTTPPEITCPDDLTVQCVEDVPDPDIGLVVASDNCGPVEITWVGDERDGNTCPLVITRTYQAEDACGNTATCTQLITVNDTTPPEITCPGPVEVQCIEDVPAPDIGAAIATDNCGNVSISWEGDEAVGTCPTVITRTYRATDDCGNTADCTQTITVNDTIPPVITCPVNVEIDCSAPVPPPDFAGGSASDNCGPVEVTWLGDVAVGDCPMVITRTYQAEDACGNTATCDQLITIVDNTPPTITCPDAVAVECDEPVPAPDPGSVVATDDCHDVVVTWEGDESDGQTCPETITRTYRATDECGNFAECQQIITVDDTTAPTVFCPGDIDATCTETLNITVTAEDNCDTSPSISCTFDSADPGSFTVQELGNGHFTVTASDTTSITVTCIAVDECGNESEPCSFVITVTCGEACSPGYWRQPQHFDSWCDAGYQPIDNYCGPGAATKFVDAFGITDFSSPEIPGGFDMNMTLLTALQDNGGDYYQMLFHGAAALLNAASPGVSFGPSVGDVQQVMQDAFAGDITFEEAFHTFSGWNSVEQDGGCPLN